MANLYLATSKVQCQQSSWKISSVYAQVDVAAQLIIIIVHAVRTVCIAQSCARVIAMNIPPSIGDQDILSDYGSEEDGDDNDNVSE